MKSMREGFLLRECRMVYSNMKIQISNKRRVDGLPTMWPIEGENVDMILPITAPAVFPFNRDRLKTIYEFGALGNCDPKDINKTIMQWLRALKKGGSIIIVEVDFERATRQFIGADISLDEFNAQYNRRTHLVKEDLAEKLQNIGVPFDNIKQWSGGHKDFLVHPHEFVMEVIKP